MSEIYTIAKVALDNPNKAAEISSQENLHPVVQVQAASSKEPVQTDRVAPSKEANQPEKPRSELPLKGMENVRLKYTVDPDTKEVTVLMIDRSTKEVIRTIPSEELKKFQKGDLLELAS